MPRKKIPTDPARALMAQVLAMPTDEIEALYRLAGAILDVRMQRASEAGPPQAHDRPAARKRAPRKPSQPTGPGSTPGRAVPPPPPETVGE